MNHMTSSVPTNKISLPKIPFLLLPRTNVYGRVGMVVVVGGVVDTEFPPLWFN